MKALFGATLLLVIVSQCTGADWGGVQIVLKQAGLNTITSFLQDYISLVLNQKAFGEYKILTLIINNIRILNTDGLYTTASIQPNNTVEVTLGFKGLSLEANVTVNDPRDILRSPDTLIKFVGAQIIIQFQLGTGNDGKNIDIDDCHTDIKDMKLMNVSGEVEAILRAVWRYGRMTVFEKVKEFCPQLHNLTRTKYRDILDFEGYLTIKGDGPTPFPMDYRINGISTDHKEIDMKLAAGLKGSLLPKYGSHDVTFPDGSLLGHDNTKELEFWFEQEILNILFLKSLEIETVVPTSFSTLTSDKHDFDVPEKSQKAWIEITPGGIVLKLSYNTTLVQLSNTSENCVALRTKTVAVLPFLIETNNTRLRFLPDPRRYQINTTIASWDLAYPTCGPVNPDFGPIKYQRQVLQNFTRAFQKNFNHRFAYTKIWRDDYPSLVKTTIETLKGYMIVTANIAEGSKITVEHTIRTEYKYYTHSRIQYTYTDKSQEVFIDGHPAPPHVSLGCRSSVHDLLPCLLSFLWTLLLFCF